MAGKFTKSELFTASGESLSMHREPGDNTILYCGKLAKVVAYLLSPNYARWPHINRCSAVTSL